MKNIACIGMIGNGTSFIASEIVKREAERGMKIVVVGERKKEEPFNNDKVYEITRNEPLKMESLPLTRK